MNVILGRGALFERNLLWGSEESKRMWGKEKMRIWGQSRVYGMCLSLFIHLIVPAAKKLIETWNIDAWKNPTEALVKQTSRIELDVMVLFQISIQEVSLVWQQFGMYLNECLLRGLWGAPWGVWMLCICLPSKGLIFQRVLPEKGHWLPREHSGRKCLLISHLGIVWGAIEPRSPSPRWRNLFACSFHMEMPFGKHALPNSIIQVCLPVLQAVQNKQDSRHANFSRMCQKFPV